MYLPNSNQLSPTHTVRSKRMIPTAGGEKIQPPALDRSPAQPNTWHATASWVIKASHTAIQGHARDRKLHLCDELTHSPHHVAQNMQLVHLLSALRATAAPEKGTSQYKSARVDTVAHPSPPVTFTTRHTSQYGHCGQPEADTHPLCGLWRSCVGRCVAKYTSVACRCMGRVAYLVALQPS